MAVRPVLLSEYFPDITTAQETLEPYITSLVSILGGKLPHPTIASIKSQASVNPFTATDKLFSSLIIPNSPALPVVVKFCQNTPELKHILAPKYRNGVAVLSLDGGGVRGYATLLILDHIMNIVQRSLNLSQPLKPCEVFDLICGTSTGGLIAILLGRLKLTVPEAIEYYLRLGPKIFGDEANVLRTVLNGSKFDERVFEEEITELVLRHEGSANAEMVERPGKVPCFTFVTTVSIDQPAPASPYKICNYNATERAPGPYGHKWTIVQAARATSAAPVYFKPLVLPDPSFKFQDPGASGFNNPAEVARYEMGQIRELTGRALQVMLSLGTGMKDITPSDKHDASERQKAEENFIEKLQAKAASFTGLTGVWSNVDALKQIGKDLVSVATDSNRVDHEVGHKIRETYPKAYFRFSPRAGLGNVLLSDYQATSIMNNAVDDCLKSSETEIKECAGLLQPIAELKQSLKGNSG